MFLITEGQLSYKRNFAVCACELWLQLCVLTMALDVCAQCMKLCWEVYKLVRVSLRIIIHHNSNKANTYCVGVIHTCQFVSIANTYSFDIIELLIKIEQFVCTYMYAELAS